MTGWELKTDGRGNGSNDSEKRGERKVDGSGEGRKREGEERGKEKRV